jgi:hypothetical protein
MAQEIPSLCTLLPFFYNKSGIPQDGCWQTSTRDQRQTRQRPNLKRGQPNSTRESHTTSRSALKRVRFSDCKKNSAAELAASVVEDQLVMGSYVPIISVQMQKVQPQALVDSGAEYSVVCEELILHVFGRLWLEETMTRPRQTTQFRLGDGQFASALVWSTSQSNLLARSS